MLHWYCWPFTCTHCHQHRNIEEEKNPAVRAVDASFHQLSHTYTCIHVQVHTQRLLSTSANTLRQTSEHTHICTHSHPDNLYLLQYVFAEQSLFPCAWLTGFSLSLLHRPPTSDATITQPCESFWECADKQVHPCKLHICSASQ